MCWPVKPASPDSHSRPPAGSGQLRLHACQVACLITAVRYLYADAMSVSVLVAVLSLIVSSGTLFLISYLERKQTRQVEAYKRDPSVGLCPPPTWLWVVTARHGPRLVRYCITYGASLFLVISGLSKSGPATRWSVFLIAYGIGTLVLNLSLEITFRVNVAPSKCSKRFRIWWAPP